MLNQYIPGYLQALQKKQKSPSLHALNGIAFKLQTDKNRIFRTVLAQGFAFSEKESSLLFHYLDENGKLQQSRYYIGVVKNRESNWNLWGSNTTSTTYQVTPAEQSADTKQKKEEKEEKKQEKSSVPTLAQRVQAKIPEQARQFYEQQIERLLSYLSIAKEKKTAKPSSTSTSQSAAAVESKNVQTPTALPEIYFTKQTTRTATTYTVHSKSIVPDGGYDTYLVKATESGVNIGDSKLSSDPATLKILLEQQRPAAKRAKQQKARNLQAQQFHQALARQLGQLELKLTLPLQPRTYQLVANKDVKTHQRKSTVALRHFSDADSKGRQFTLLSSTDPRTLEYSVISASECQERNTAGNKTLTVQALVQKISTLSKSADLRSVIEDLCASCPNATNSVLIPRITDEKTQTAQDEKALHAAAQSRAEHKEPSAHGSTQNLPLVRIQFNASATASTSEAASIPPAQGNRIARISPTDTVILTRLNAQGKVEQLRFAVQHDKKQQTAHFTYTKRAPQSSEPVPAGLEKPLDFKGMRKFIAITAQKAAVSGLEPYQWRNNKAQQAMLTHARQQLLAYQKKADGWFPALNRWWRGFKNKRGKTASFEKYRAVTTVLASTLSAIQIAQQTISNAAFETALGQLQSTNNRHEQHTIDVNTEKSFGGRLGKALRAINDVQADGSYAKLRAAAIKAFQQQHKPQPPLSNVRNTVHNSSGAAAHNSESPRRGGNQPSSSAIPNGATGARKSNEHPCS